MRGFYSVKPRGRSALLRPRRGAGPDAYCPSSPNYAARHRETRSIEIGGTVRVDIGEPVKRLPCEGRQITVTPVSVPVPAAVETEADSVMPPRPEPRDWRRDYGLRKDL